MNDQIYIYKLINPQKIISKKAFYAKNIFGITREKEDILFDISEKTGYISYVDYSRIWKISQKSNLIQNPKDALKMVLKFLENSNAIIEKFRNENSINSEDLPNIFPPLSYLDLQEIVSVNQSSNNFDIDDDNLYTYDLIDHWFCQFSIKIPSFEKNFAPLTGSTIEIRLNPNNRIVALKSQWKPISQRMLVPNIPVLNNGLKKDHELPETHTHVNHEEYMIYYPLSSESEFQNILVPYYFHSNNFIHTHSGHENKNFDLIRPASQFSLIAYIEQEQQGDEGTLLNAKIIYPHNMQSYFKFRWMVWKLDEGINGKIKRISDTDSIRVKNDGVFDVHLEVEFQINKEVSSSTFAHVVVYPTYNVDDMPNLA